MRSSIRLALSLLLLPILTALTSSAVAQSNRITTADSTHYIGRVLTITPDTVTIEVGEGMVVAIPSDSIVSVGNRVKAPYVRVRTGSGMEYVGHLVVESPRRIYVHSSTGAATVIPRSVIREFDRSYADIYLGFGLAGGMPGLYNAVVEAGIGRANLRFSGGGFMGWGCQADLQWRIGGSNAHGTGFLFGLGSIKILTGATDDPVYDWIYFHAGFNVHLGGFDLLLTWSEKVKDVGEADPIKSFPMFQVGYVHRFL